MGSGHRGMRFDRMIKAVGPIAMMAAMAAGRKAAERSAEGKWGGEWANAWSGRMGGKFRFNGQQGAPLDALDMGAQVPRELVLFGPDQVVITQGDEFAIALQGPEQARAAMRFVLQDGALCIMRDPASSVHDDALASIAVTMPTLEKLTLAGSGDVTCHALAAEAEVVIAGSGQLSAHGLALDELQVTLAGSGTFTADGAARKLALSIAGSGSAEMATLLVDKAEVDIAGSGAATFACDGKVRANIMGSGTVTVRGAARCKVRSMGLGWLVCEPRPASGNDKAE